MHRAVTAIASAEHAWLRLDNPPYRDDVNLTQLLERVQALPMGERARLV